MSPPPPSDILTLHKSLTTLSTTLLSELSLFHTHLTTLLTTTPTPLITHPNSLLSKFEVDVRRELDHLLKYSGSNPGTPTQTDSKRDEDGNAVVDLDGIHRIRSSNITFLADVWEGVKSGTGVVGIRKGVRYFPGPVAVAVPVSDPGLGGIGSFMIGGQAAGVRGGAEGEAMVGAGTGIKGVSKKMNREARERVKRERKVGGMCQSQSLSQDQPQYQTSTKKDTSIDENRDEGEMMIHEPLTHIPNARRDHYRRTKEKPTTTATTTNKSKDSVTIDIISDHGKTWTKMFTKNERWLLMDLAKEGIIYEDSLSDSSTDDSPANSAIEDLKLVKMAREFIAASRTARVGRDHRHPRVRFQLPRIRKGESRDVDLVLGWLERIGVDVIAMGEMEVGASRWGGCGDGRNEKEDGMGKGVGLGMNESDSYESRLSEAFERMACPSPSVSITETLNVDCTILIALTSDVSHMRQKDIQIPLHYQGNARRDIEVQLQTDVEDPLLPKHIYPILRGRRLVCTRKATEHWKNIVRIMGSPTEAERCNIFLGEVADGGSQGLSARQRLQNLSVHEVPEDLQLPFEIVDFDLDDMNADAENNRCNQVEIDVMRQLAKEPRLSSLNSSVFFHGWYKGLTTVSLNRVVSEWMNRAINVILDDLELRAGITSDIAEEMGFCGANVLICGRERSLLGSEK